MGDLKNPKWIYLKGFLFLVILLVCACWLIFESTIWMRIVLILLLIWSSARLYYFMFYVIENYVDSDFKFAGIVSFVQYLLRRKRE